MFSFLGHRKTFLYISLSIAAIFLSSRKASTDDPHWILLSYAGAVLFVVAFTNKWLKTRSYILLALVSSIMILISIILNNLFEEYSGATLFAEIKDFLYFMSVFICPFGIVFGIIGSIFLAENSAGK